MTMTTTMVIHVWNKVLAIFFSMLFFSLVGCAEKDNKAYDLSGIKTSSGIAYSECTEIIATNLLVNYIAGDDPTDIFAQERLEQNRTIYEIHTISTNEHTYLLEQDVMKTVVRYIDGFHFSEDGKTEIVENPLQGKTLCREYVNGKWGNFSLLGGEVSEELAIEVGKVNDNYALEEGIYPEHEVHVGDTWSGTNFVEHSDGTTSESTYRAIFEKVGNHRGYPCAQLNVQTGFHSESNGLVLDLKGTVYYSLEHGIELNFEMSGSMCSMSDHEVGDHIVQRIVEGEININKTAELRTPRKGSKKVVRPLF